MPDCKPPNRQCCYGWVQRSANKGRGFVDDDGRETDDITKAHIFLVRPDGDGFDMVQITTFTQRLVELVED